MVNSGSSNGSFHNGGARDYGIDQIVDLSRVGKEYILVRGDGSDGWENILVVGHEDGTEINIYGSSNSTQTINAGEYHLIEGDLFSSDDNMYISSNKDVFVYQGTGGSTEANQEMFFVPPISCGSRGDVNNIPWDTKIIEDTAKKCTVEFIGRSLRSPFEIKRVISLNENDSFIEINQEVKNFAEEDLNIVWLEHIAIGGSFLSQNCTLTVPDCTIPVSYTHLTLPTNREV